MMYMPLKPIIPFEPISTESIPTGDQWISQIKWDGVRILTYFDGSQVRLFNRRKNERTLHYPELSSINTYCQADSVILDGEIIALGSNGKPSFHEVMKRDAIRRMQKVEKAKQSVPITYMIFDIIFFNDEWINLLPLHERLELLTEIIIPNEHIQVVPSLEDASSLYQTIIEYDMEGIIIKDLNSKYTINGKNDSWQKKKHYKDIIAVVGGVTLRNGIINALLLGLYNNKGELFYIGHAGTGKLTQHDWRELTAAIQQGMIIEERPFVNLPERNKDALWVKPELTVKIKFMEWTRNKTLRQPSVQSIVKVHVKECTFDQT